MALEKKSSSSSKSSTNPYKTAAPKVKAKKKVSLTKAEVKKLKKRMASLKKGNKASTQSFLPYQHIYSDGVCHIKGKLYSKTMQFSDINYRLATEDRAEEIFTKYCRLINYFDDSVHVQFSFENQNSNIEEINEKLEIPPRGDSFDDIRQEYSDMLKKQVVKGRNGKVLKKYVTFTVEADNLRLARVRLVSIAAEVQKLFKSFDVKCRVLDGKERLELLYKSCNPFSDEPFIYDEVYMKKTGMSSQDFVAPPSMRIMRDSFEMSSCNGAVTSLNILAGEMSDETLSDFMALDDILSINIHVDPYDKLEATQYIKAKLSDVEKMKVDEQKKAVRAGYDPDILPPALVENIDSLKAVLEALRSGNERLFKATYLVRGYAKTKKQLVLQQEKLKRVAQAKNCKLFPLDYRQEQALASTFPIGHNNIGISRILPTSAVAGFIPFTTQELFQGATATYYGLNVLSNNLIMASRVFQKNPNGLILGTPGSGKSFAAKREIIDLFLRTMHDIIICDPEGEYLPLVEKLGGEIVTISYASKQWVNPMEIFFFEERTDQPESKRREAREKNEELIAVKADFIFTLMQIIVGESDPLSAQERTFIDSCVNRIYHRFLESGAKFENMPMLENLWMEFKKSGATGVRLADSLELYVNGSQKLFNHRSTVDMRNRVICFNIRDMGNQLRQIAMLIIQDTVWNRVSANRETGKYTNYYIDEFHLLLKEPQTALYSVEMWKRFRKWRGIPTGMTQNVKDLLRSKEIENIFDNSDFVYMLNQAAGDRDILQEKLKISDEQMAYVTNQDRGHGLIFFGDVILPFKDEFPKNTKIYQLITTNPEDKKTGEDNSQDNDSTTESAPEQYDSRMSSM